MNIKQKLFHSGAFSKAVRELICLVIVLIYFMDTIPDLQAAVENPSVVTLQEEVRDLQQRVVQLEEQLTLVLKLVDKDSSAVTHEAIRETVIIKDDTSRGTPTMGPRVAGFWPGRPVWPNG